MCAGIGCDASFSGKCLKGGFARVFSVLNGAKYSLYFFVCLTNHIRHNVRLILPLHYRKEIIIENVLCVLNLVCLVLLVIDFYINNVPVVSGEKQVTRYIVFHSEIYEASPLRSYITVVHGNT